MSEPQIDFKTRQSTVWIIGVVSVGLIAWDLYAGFFTAGAGDTISEVVLGAAKAHPIVPFLAGVLSGHLFWPQIARAVPPNEKEKPN